MPGGAAARKLNAVIAPSPKDLATQALERSDAAVQHWPVVVIIILLSFYVRRVKEKPGLRTAQVAGDF